jgi:hypothetical protein
MDEWMAFHRTANKQGKAIAVAAAATAKGKLHHYFDLFSTHNFDPIDN